MYWTVPKISRNARYTLALLLFSLPYHAAGAQTEVSISYLRGGTEDYLQTPSGGQLGTTTHERPTLKELGIDSVSIPIVEMRRIIGKHKILGGYERIRMDSTATLIENLTSQNKNFHAGEVVKANLKGDVLRLNYFYQRGATELMEKPFNIFLGAGLALFDFHYELDSATLKVDRSYAKLGYRIGAELDWLLTDKLKLSFNVFEGLPIPNTPIVLSSELQVKYTLWKNENIIAIETGIVYNRIDYEDEQTVPNHIYIKTGPLFKVGLSITL